MLLLIATFLLVWSMNRHLRKLPESFDRRPEPDQAADESPATPDSNVSPGVTPGG